MGKPNTQLNASLAIASIFAFRMLGLFMLIPVFTLYAKQLSLSTPSLIGIGLGIYGLTQGLLQIPFGFLSDKYGRKPIIAIGLILFAAGSLMAAFSTNIYMMIIARGLQGSGAIGSSLIALLADLTDDKHRTKAMALLGMTIGFSFSLAMVIGPPIARHFQLSGIFILTFMLAVIAIAMLYSIVPTPNNQSFKPDSMLSTSMIKHVLSDRELLRLNLGIFFQHGIFTATFYAIPLILNGMVTTLWHFYLPIIIIGFMASLPLIIVAEKKQQLKPVFLSAIGLLFVSQVALTFSHHHLGVLVVELLIFFTAFNVLEASLPSLVSKTAPKRSKGTAMGIYSSFQFLGIFTGAVMAGYLYARFNLVGIFIFCTVSAVFWLITASSMKEPRYISSVPPMDIDGYNEPLKDLEKTR